MTLCITTKALHLGVLNTHNIICRMIAPSFPARVPVQGNYLYFFRENTFPAEKID